MLERCDQFARLVMACDSAGVDVQSVARHVAVMNEYAARLDERPFPGGRTIRIIECSELSVWDLGASVISFARGCTRLLGPNYPERVDKVFLVNTSTSFAVCFQFFSSLFTRHLLDKVSVFSSSAAGTAAASAALLEVIPPENLPAVYGGQCKCVGQGGCWRNAPEEAELWRIAEATTPPELRQPA